MDVFTKKYKHIEVLGLVNNVDFSLDIYKNIKGLQITEPNTNKELMLYKTTNGNYIFNDSSLKDKLFLLFKEKKPNAEIKIDVINL